MAQYWRHFKSPGSNIMQTFGLWELSYIAAHPSPRRTSLFTDIERPTGSIWSQVHTACIGDIDAIRNRIAAFQSPTSSQTASKPQKLAVVETLPRIGTPLRHENILGKAPTPSTSVEQIESNIGAITKSYGQSPDPGTLKLPSSATSPSRKLFQNLLPSTPPRKLLTEGLSSKQDQSTESGLRAIFIDYVLTFLRSPFGGPFRQTFSRRARSIVLGSPTSCLHPLLSSIRIISSLAVASLKEDPFGRVSKDVPPIIRTFISTIQLIDNFVFKGGLPVHWTDVYFEKDRQVQGRQVPEIDTLVQELKEGLKELVDAFEAYAEELGITKGDLAAARALTDGMAKRDGKESRKGSLLKASV